MSFIKKNGLKISSILFDFINKEVIPGTDIQTDKFWDGFEKTVHELAPINKKLIEKRETIQKDIDNWHKKNKGKESNKKEYTEFLKSISYIVEEKEDFNIETTNVDSEISSIAGPQLVVPVDNARYALNAANARWGSLYDALYGTDVILGDKGKDVFVHSSAVKEAGLNYLNEGDELTFEVENGDKGPSAVKLQKA